MEIIERKFAAEAGMKKYFTGKSCKNGHVAPRYVASGACQACLNGEASINDAANAKIKPEEVDRLTYAKRIQEERKQAMILAKNRQDGAKKRDEDAKNILKDMREIKLICYDNCWSILRNMVVDVVRARFPVLTEIEIVQANCRLDSVSNAQGKYAVWLHNDDVASVNAMTDELNNIEAENRENLRTKGVEGVIKSFGAAIRKRGHYEQHGDWWYHVDDLDRLTCNTVKSVSPFAPATQYIPVSIDLETVKKAIGWDSKTAKATDWHELQIRKPIGDIDCTFLQIEGEWFRTDKLQEMIIKVKRTIMSMDPYDSANH